MNALGIAYRHAYTVIDTKKLKDGTKLVKIRNPWGEEKYHGPWSDKDSRWTDENRTEVDLVEKDDGLWWIDAANYHSNFEFTQTNANTVDQHLAYYAMFDLPKDKKEVDELKVTSNVA